MSRKPYYKNVNTGNYGVIEGISFSTTPRVPSNGYLSLKLFQAVNGMVELGLAEEQVLPENLVEVSREEVQRAILGF